MTRDQFNLLDDLLTESADENNDTFGTQRHDSSISVPQTTQLTTKQHNDALAALKKSFKEAYDVLDVLTNSEVVEDVYSEQADFTENAIVDALYESTISGPIFERVYREDKDEVKSIIKTIGTDLAKTLHKDRSIVYKPYKFILKVLSDTFSLGSLPRSIIDQVWMQYSWQFIGTIGCEKDDIGKIVDGLNEKYADQLGQYRILSVYSMPNMIDLFRTKFYFKNHNYFYMLLVDKKLPKEITKGIKDTNNALAAINSKKGEKDNNDKEEK